jgi:hypothetical protein
MAPPVRGTLARPSSNMDLRAHIEAEGGADLWARPAIPPINEKKDKIGAFPKSMPRVQYPDTNLESIPANRCRARDGLFKRIYGAEDVRCNGGASELTLSADWNAHRARRAGIVCWLTLRAFFHTSMSQYPAGLKIATCNLSCRISRCAHVCVGVSSEFKLGHSPNSLPSQMSSLSTNALCGDTVAMTLQCSSRSPCWSQGHFRASEMSLVHSFAQRCIDTWTVTSLRKGRGDFQRSVLRFSSDVREQHCLYPTLHDRHEGMSSGMTCRC